VRLRRTRGDDRIHLPFGQQLRYRIESCRHPDPVRKDVPQFAAWVRQRRNPNIRQGQERGKEVADGLLADADDAHPKRPG
jgi:hypothetical protein